jgi:hypothetical protein
MGYEEWINDAQYRDQYLALVNVHGLPVFKKQFAYY